MTDGKIFLNPNKPQGLNMADNDLGKVHFYLDCGIIAASCIGIASMISFLAVM